MNIFDYINLQLLFNITVYFCIGLLLACLYLYLVIPSLKSEDYTILFSIVLFWPPLIPIYIVIYIGMFLFNLIDAFKRKRRQDS